MPITQEQINFFKHYPFPEAAIFTKDQINSTVKKGNEALVIRVVDKAFKCYIKLESQKVDDLRRYADGVNQDEQKYRQLGLSEAQLPDSHFFIASDQANSTQLYAIQPWIEGRLLKEYSLKEIRQNSTLRDSLRRLFLIAHEFNKQTGRFMDLKGSEKFFGIVADPTKIVWPFRSTNIIVSDNIATLTDARALSPQPGSIKYQAAQVHQIACLLATRTLLRS